MRPNVREHPISVHRNRLDIEEWDAVVDAVLDAVRDAVRDAMRDANYNEVNVGMGSAPEKSFPSDSSRTLVRTLVESNRYDISARGAQNFGNKIRSHPLHKPPRINLQS